MIEETPSKYDFDLLEDSNLTMLARVGRAVTQEKFKDDRSWVKFGRRAIWVNRTEYNEKNEIVRGPPKVVTVLKEHIGPDGMVKVKCIMEDESTPYVHYEKLFWLPSIEEYMSFEEWPSGIPHHWMLDPCGSVFQHPDDESITEKSNPDTIATPIELLVVVALAWLKAWSEKDD